MKLPSEFTIEYNLSVEITMRSLKEEGATRIWRTK